jgi:hypothetical protein
VRRKTLGEVRGLGRLRGRGEAMKVDDAYQYLTRPTSTCTKFGSG